MKASLLVLAVVSLAYLLFWPVPIDPVAWQAPKNRGYLPPFEANTVLDNVQRLRLQDEGPEMLAVSPEGQVHMAMLSGAIDRLNARGQVETWVNTGGRPLGMAFDVQGDLIVADAFQGVLRIDAEGEQTPVLTHVGEQPLRYANSVAIGPDGTLYVSESTQRHAAAEYGTYQASLLDINEHGGSGRVLAVSPDGEEVKELVTGLNFANGVAVLPSGEALLISETGRYRVLKHHLQGERAGETEVLISNLPGFPDNLNPGPDGLFWLGLVSPRSAPLDSLSNWPYLRKVVQRLPAFVRPQARPYGHLVGFDEQGVIHHNLQGPSGHYAYITGAVVSGRWLYLSSLHEDALGRLPWPIPVTTSAYRVADR
ncbi:SMP-30/gluconolactonase/LRE family protein [Ferrimonas marina]|uniref:Sugar lactone lactonase YvrE n=1 Tax=Ferrimonas marina TaxID=299255 RepID=A0A1M5Z523_9GAMM|nr:SMP-30/gluconolactonase/LRE family protein [Ferrimonas marina]SHI19234.1 Sugar lactone lactonase YvrE [Ferrimonas marina]